MPTPAPLLSPVQFAGPEHVRHIDRRLRRAGRTWADALAGAEVPPPPGWAEPADERAAVELLRAWLHWRSAGRIEAALPADGGGWMGG